MTTFPPIPQWTHQHPSTTLNPCNDRQQKQIEAIKRKQRAELSNRPEYKERVSNWLIHRVKVANVRPVIDSSPPDIPLCTLESIRKTTESRLYGKIEALQAENMAIIRRIGEIYLGKGYIDHHLDPMSLHINTRSPKSRTYEELYRPVAESRIKPHNIKAKIQRKKHLEEYALNEKWIQLKSLFPLYWNDKHCTAFEAEAMNNALQYGSNPIVFFDFEMDSDVKGRVYIELYPLSAPGPVESFIRLCTQTRMGSDSFVCRQIDSMWPKMFWIIGKGIQGRHKEPFFPRKNGLKHDRKGVVSLLNNGENVFEGAFMISGGALPPLDGVNLPIGRVIKGLRFLKSLRTELKRRGMTFRKPIKIMSAGLAPTRVSDPEDSDQQFPEDDTFDMDQRSSSNVIDAQVEVDIEAEEYVDLFESEP